MSLCCRAVTIVTKAAACYRAVGLTQMVLGAPFAWILSPSEINVFLVGMQL